LSAGRPRPLARLAFVATMVLILMAALTPEDVMSHSRGSLELLGRIFIYAISIVLEAAPFVLAGSVASTLAQRFAGGAVAAALLAAFAPGCDCAMNGFAAALRRCGATIAGMALTWGAVCNPIALWATATILGTHVLAARLIGGAVATATLGLLWRADHHVDDAGGHHTCIPAANVAVHLEDGLRLLLPAAFAGSAALVLAPNLLRAHASPFFAALAGAVLSPCSTADPVLAKVLAVSASSQAAFVVAAQCADLRQLAVLARHFGMRRAVLAAVAGAAGSLAASIAVR
jgi:uncharacterized membrane protein YraQ (UPF0718 family)